MLTEGTDYTVAYSNNVNAGTATVAITGIGDYTGKTEKTFSISKADQNLSVKIKAETIYVGRTTKVTASGARETRKYIFTSSNPKVAAVDAKGKVTGKSAGKSTITVKTPETANYKAGAKTVEITVKKVPKKPGSGRGAWNKAAGAVFKLIRDFMWSIFY